MNLLNSYTEHFDYNNKNWVFVNAKIGQIKRHYSIDIEFNEYSSLMIELFISFSCLQIWMRNHYIGGFLSKKNSWKSIHIYIKHERVRLWVRALYIRSLHSHALTRNFAFVYLKMTMRCLVKWNESKIGFNYKETNKKYFDSQISLFPRSNLMYSPLWLVFQNYKFNNKNATKSTLNSNLQFFNRFFMTNNERLFLFILHFFDQAFVIKWKSQRNKLMNVILTVRSHVWGKLNDYSSRCNWFFFFTSFHGKQ